MKREVATHMSLCLSASALRSSSSRFRASSMRLLMAFSSSLSELLDDVEERLLWERTHSTNQFLNNISNNTQDYTARAPSKEINVSGYVQVRLADDRNQRNNK